ncbi:LacI family DNA-binding transcriptional regulator [Paenibacillus sp. R14(2021)]|uniref:LacI family DNA-binding transcriptional regulator n=1 Tax=Paenibacillus sp. R14(2021) TaxID=2859228 RepID=UPI001C615FAD|nr:LacI family DNA-binding transcriptional regulator [Paenibacillus sp. R14(2021)]
MATIHDVAEIAGVSVTTVSRVLNNRGYISDKTRKKVFETMQALNYHPNEIARSLLRKQSNLIGLIIPNVSHPFFSEFTLHLETYAYQNGFKLLLCNSLSEPDKEKDYIEMMRKNRVAGIIMGSHTLDVSEYLNLNYPIVTLDRKIADSIPYLSSDNYAGGQAATQLLIDCGCKKIANICGNLSLPQLANERTSAFRDIATSNGIEYVIMDTETNVFEYGQYETLVRKLFDEHPDVDGIFATSDVMASYVIKVARSLNRQIPNDLKVIGYDDTQFATWTAPSITSIKQPIEELSNLAFDIIYKQINEEAIEMHNVLPITLVERETTSLL